MGTSRKAAGSSGYCTAICSVTVKMFLERSLLKRFKHLTKYYQHQDLVSLIVLCINIYFKRALIKGFLCRASPIFKNICSRIRKRLLKGPVIIYRLGGLGGFGYENKL